VALGFKTADREQQFLLPPDVREWLPADHLGRFVMDAVDELDVSAIEAGYRLGRQGRAAYEPRMLVAVLLYGYAVGLRSSRRIEQACVTDVALRVITVNQQPDHATIARFRARFEAELADLFGQVLGLCVRAGIVDPSVVAVDSTRLAAAASKDANASVEQVEAIARQVLEEAAVVDAAEDRRYGPDQRGDEPAPGWEAGAGRKAKIREALEELAAQQRDPGQGERDAQRQARLAAGRPPRGRPRLPADPSKRSRVESKKANAKVNLTDPQSRLMKVPGGYQQAYSAQAAAVAGQVIVAAEVTNEHNDTRMLWPLLMQARQQLACHDLLLDTALADRGYWNPDDLAELEQEGIHTLVAPVKGRTLDQGRPVQLPARSKLRWMAQRFADPEQAMLYRRRSVLIEPIFGHLKTNLGITRFLRRGLNAVNSEWKLICTAHNLATLHRARLAGT
jgi:transposase